MFELPARRESSIGTNPSALIGRGGFLWPAALLFGCLFGCRADEPLAPLSGARFDEGLIGAWQLIDADSGASAEAPMLVMRFGETEYIAGHLALGNETFNLDTLYRFYVTEHAGYRFLNLQPLEEDVGHYYFMRLESVTEDDVVLQILPEDVFPSEDMTSGELVGFLLEHAEDPALFSPDGRLRYRKIGEDRDSIRTPSADEFEVEFGFFQPLLGVRELTTIPQCEPRRFGFEVTPPDSLSWEYEFVHELPAMPAIVSGRVLDPGPPVRLREPGTTVRGRRRLAFYFDAGDPLGTYHTELYVNGSLSTAVDYAVVAPAGPGACGPR